MERYGKPEIMNSDQDSQFTGLAFTRYLVDEGIQISMDGKWGRLSECPKTVRHYTLLSKKSVLVRRYLLHLKVPVAKCLSTVLKLKPSIEAVSAGECP